ncbi:DUF411 domain-containing protein [Psychrobacter aquimaris]|uniref:DUF411 domain-containing protein n=1 Tax=Psychrobacter aquimaris TaxID=292733 RepID=UPI003FD0087A
MIAFTVKFFRGAALLSTAVILSACGQSDINASNASSSTANASNASSGEANARQIKQTVTPANNPDLLKKVSATVYKDANCGCCKEWIGHAEDNGLTTTNHDVADLSLFKERYGVPTEMRSCHTAVTSDGYVIEGHVPAKYVAEFLQNPPKQAIGLAVPGMPVGSPGMEYQDKFMPYQIMQINKDGTNQVYAEVEFAEQQL